MIQRSRVLMTFKREFQLAHLSIHSHEIYSLKQVVQQVYTVNQQQIEPVYVVEFE